MPVVINEFEVVAEAPTHRRQEPSELQPETPAAPETDPRRVAVALRALDVRKLRVWAH